jgi:hypothetical protein
MTTTTPSPGALMPVAQPLFTVAERQALAGFLSGYSGLTRDAYTLDLRQHTSWCAQHGLHPFTAKRVDIESFRGETETAGRARATIARRLCTIAGFYRYAVEEELLEHSPAAHAQGRQDRHHPASAADRPQPGPGDRGTRGGADLPPRRRQPPRPARRPAGSCAVSPNEPGSQSRSARTPCGMPSLPRPSTPGSRCLTFRKRHRMLIRGQPCAMTVRGHPWTGTPPTSSPPTSPAQPAEQQRRVDHRRGAEKSFARAVVISSRFPVSTPRLSMPFDLG